MKKALTLFVVLFSSLLLLTACSKKLEIQNWDKVTVSYDSFGQDWIIIEQNQWLTFVIGLQQSFPIFETQLLNMKAWEKKEFEANSELWYGIKYDDSKIQHLNPLIFEKAGITPIVGEVITLWEMKWKVLEIEENIVKVDFNESYTSETVNFIVEILNIERN